MRQAKLYTLNEQDVIVAGDYIEYHNMRLPMAGAIPVHGPEILHSIHAVRLPIHHVRKIEAGVQTDNFIAMSPELREIFDATYMPLVENALKRKQAMMAELLQYESRIIHFNSLPWYKRIFKWV